MSEIKLEKLDNRHSLNTFFTHRIKMFGDDKTLQWVEMRNWMWEQYGPGLEYETVWLLKYNPKLQCKWAWRVNDSYYYIYLKDEMLTHFSLKYLNT
jgi:hypothetical protein